jgi:hypothetical protein
MFALITASVLTVSLAAQEYAIPEPESNTSLATEGNFGTDVDNFLHLHNWGDVAFDKYFSYAGFRAYAGGNDDFDAYELNAGYARRFGGLYLGLFYAGQISEAGSAWEKTTSTKTTNNALTGGTYQKTGETTTVEQGESGTAGASVTEPGNPGTPNDPPRFYNNIGALVGIAGMGIKVGFYETLWGTDKYNLYPEDLPGSGIYTGNPIYGNDTTSNVDGTKTVNIDITDYNELKGWIVPYLGWGMQLPVGGLTIKPKANLDLALFVDETKFSVAANNVTVNGNPIGSQNSSSAYVDNGYFRLGVSVGADVDFAPIANHSFGAGLVYTITPDIYSHKFDTASGEDTVNGTVAAVNFTQRTVTAIDRETIKASVATTEEITSLGQVINPSFWYSNELSETISLGIGYDLAFTIGTNNRHEKNITKVITNTVPHDGSVSTRTTEVTTEDVRNFDETTFAVDSSIGAGFSWQVKPGRFTLNAGLGITLPSYKSVTTHDKPLEATIARTDTELSDGTNTSAVTIDPAKAVAVVDKTVVEQEWTGVSATYSLGGTFYFTPNFLVDMYFNTLSGSASANPGNEGAALIDFGNGFEYSLFFTLKY